jgi:hypothetical protein
MIRITMVDESGKTVLPEDLTTMAELYEAAEKARALVRVCDRLGDLKNPKRAAQQQGRVPYV